MLIDNFNGPVGMLVGSGLGITRTMFCSPDNIADFTPVDICIKAQIISAWKRALDTKWVEVISCKDMKIYQQFNLGNLCRSTIAAHQTIVAPLWIKSSSLEDKSAMKFHSMR